MQKRQLAGSPTKADERTLEERLEELEVGEGEGEGEGEEGSSSGGAEEEEGEEESGKEGEQECAVSFGVECCEGETCILASLLFRAIVNIQG